MGKDENISRQVEIVILFTFNTLIQTTDRDFCFIQGNIKFNVCVYQMKRLWEILYPDITTLKQGQMTQRPFLCLFTVTLLVEVS